MNKRFVWAELMTNHQGGTSEFYRALFGWQAHEKNMGEGGNYLMMTAGEAQVAGIANVPHEVPTHWASYLEVGDVDALLPRIKELGGTLLSEPFDIPEIGRAVVAKDPNGATFMPFQGAPGSAKPDFDAAPALHSVCWREVMARDTEAAVAFYTGLVGWTAEPMGPGVTMLKEGDAVVGTVREMPEMAPKDAPSHWMHYFLVEDIDQSVSKASDLGAQVLMPGMDIPEMGRFAVLSDPTGGVFAIWKNAGAGGRD